MAFSQPIIGNYGELIVENIHSENFVTTVSGWCIRRDGTAEFMDILIRGTQTLNGDLILANDGSFHGIYFDGLGGHNRIYFHSLITPPNQLRIEAEHLFIITAGSSPSVGMKIEDNPTRQAMLYGNGTQVGCDSTHAYLFHNTLCELHTFNSHSFAKLEDGLGFSASNFDRATTNWNPTITATAPMTFTSIVYYTKCYNIAGPLYHFVLDFYGTVGGTPNGLGLTITLPKNVVQASGGFCRSTAFSGSGADGYYLVTGANTIRVGAANDSALATGVQRFWTSGWLVWI